VLQDTACARTVNLLDIYPTLVELCGLTAPRQSLDGRSIVQLLKHPKADWNYPAVTTYKEGNQSIRNKKYRYIRYSDGEEELYDEVADPREWKNLAKDPRMKRLIASFRKKLTREFAPAASNRGNNAAKRNESETNLDLNSKAQ
jgi:arylsulfatase A-like enzyme